MRQGLSEPEIYGDLVYKLKKIVGSYNFSAQFIKLFSIIKKIGCNIIVLQQTECLEVNPITVGNLLSSLIARRWFQLKDLTIDEICRGLMFWLLSGPSGFTFLISFAQEFSFIYY